jgi:uncharacterized membrane protein HdeD (DUF308 family)
MSTGRLAPEQPWWLILIEGIAAVLIGILLLSSPLITTTVLVQVLGLFWFIAGILSIVGMFVDHSRWGWKLLAGIVGIAAGIVVLRHPLWSAYVVPAALLLILGILGIVIGIVHIYRGLRGDGWGVIVLGIVSVLFGLILVLNPLPATFALPLVLGLLGVVGGILAIVIAFRMR